MLLILALIYVNAERWIGVTPLSLPQLLEILATKIEASIAFGALLIAIAARRGFIEAKQLDIKLALEAEITNIQADAASLINECTHVAERMAKIECDGREAFANVQIGVPARITAPLQREFEEMLGASRSLPSAQRGFGAISRRFFDIERKFGPVIRTSILTTIALRQARKALDDIDNAATLIEPLDHWRIEEFLLRQHLHAGSSANHFLGVVAERSGWFYGWIGAASAIGSPSIFKPSVFNVIGMAKKLW